ncbi:SDR family NAD(P)-dependent oxidoreductase [Endozoicomonas sp.]|uniref:SDR family NAD(P)-dependent oxidoreductase n=1 Tax=Endozoicomonas sp. TaxID=1892382 RepID=UPI003AF809B3
MKKLSGKVALVTGAGQGVGQGIALSLAKAGALVAVAGRTLAKCESTCEQIQELGGKAIAISMDVKDPESLSAGVERVVSELGGLNILINNAQEIALGTLNKITDEAFEAGWQSGPLATLRLMRLCYPHLKGDGVIINLASTAAKRWDMSGYGPYAAVKEATRSLSRAAACEWGPDNIRCNVVLPHAKSPSLEWWMNTNPEEAEAFVNAIPMRRVGECEDDIGRVVTNLCSDDMRYINGQSIAVDGGQAYMG